MSMVTACRATVVSPYTRRGSVDSHYYTQIDVVRAIEQILGLSPMNLMDMAIDQNSMRHVFTSRPDFKPYTARPNLIPSTSSTLRHPRFEASREIGPSPRVAWIFRVQMRPTKPLGAATSRNGFNAARVKPAGQ